VYNQQHEPNPVGEELPPPPLPPLDETQNDEPKVAPAAPPPLILAHQRPAYDRLVAVGRACLSIQRQTLPLRPRTNSLIVGPSGSGKTFLARAVAQELGLDFLSLSVGDWILLGCSGRGGSPTWPLILQFLLRNKSAPGCVVFLDEIDKVSGNHSTWERFLRAEAFRLLDFQLPTGLNDEDGDTVDDGDRLIAQEVLSNRTLIVSAGAFQHLWEKRARPALGFGKPEVSLENPTLDDLAQTLPRELVNRFRAEILVLPPLVEADYRAMLGATAEKVPAYLRKTFLRLGRERIGRAAANHQGCRFLEEVLLDTILCEREQLFPRPAPATSSPLASEHSPDPQI
jgi:SpoVK/Ycf46/Vps4 family AAA+-type ATPase